MAAPLAAVVIAGGRSRRMGRDKGALVYAGTPQVRRVVALLEAEGFDVRVSIHPEQRKLDCYAGLELVEDEGGVEGPAAGLIAAWRRAPGDAQLAVAVDLPFLTRELIAQLVHNRNDAKLATAFSHADGTLEPLCTIWEPSALRALASGPAGMSPSPRRLLEANDVERLEPVDPRALESVNTLEGYRDASARIRA